MLRSAEISDVGRLAEIQIFGWRHAYKGIVPDVELFRIRTVAWASERFTKRLEAKEEIVVSESESGILEGFAWHGELKEEKVEGSYEIYAIYVEPKLTGNGIGTKLVNRVVEIAKGKNKSELYVWLLEKNSAGRQFYLKNSFQVDGSSKFIEAWNENEIRMKKSF